MTEDHDGFVALADSPIDSSASLPEGEFRLLGWLIDTTASATCFIPPEADSQLWLHAQILLDAIHAHQKLRSARRRLVSAADIDAALACSYEQIADRLEAARRKGFMVRFRPSARTSAVELSILPAVG